MPLETASTIADLVITNPVGASDTPAALDDHIRLIKTVLKADALVNADIGVVVQPLDATLTAIADESIGAFSHRNKIINGSFEINQRGTSGTITASPAYVSDRWVAASDVNTTWNLGVGIIGGNALIWNGAAGFTYGFIQQRIEAANVSMLAGKKVTVSGWIYNNVASTRTVTLGVYTPSAVDNHTTQNLVQAFSLSLNASGWTYFSRTLSSVLSSEVTKGLAVQFLTTTLAAGEGLAFDFIQLEEGSTATPFEHRPIGTELALCQRYYYQLSWAEYSRIAIAYADTTTTAQFVMNTPVAMRAAPTVATAYLTVNGINFTGTAIPSYSNGLASLQATVAAGLTVGAAVQIYVQAGQTGAISFNAEL